MPLPNQSPQHPPAVLPHCAHHRLDHNVTLVVRTDDDQAAVLKILDWEDGVGTEVLVVVDLQNVMSIDPDLRLNRSNSWLWFSHN